MAATVERRLAEFRAARRSAGAAPRPVEPPEKAAAPEAAEGPRAAAEGPGGGAQVSAEEGGAGACGGRPVPDAALPAASAGPARRGGHSGVGAPAAAKGAAVGRAAGAVRGAGARAALLRPLPALLDVRRHPRPRRAAARRAQRLLRLQPRLRRHRRDADGRAAGAGAALPARRGQLAPGPAGTALRWAGIAAAPGRPRRLRRAEEGPGLGGMKWGLFLCRKAPEPYCWPRVPRRRPVPNKAVVKPALWSRFLAPGSCFGAPRGTALSQLRLPACHLLGFSSRELCHR